MFVFVFSCTKKEETPAPNVEYAPVSLHIHSYLDNYEVDAYDIAGSPIIYTTTEGRKISLSCAQLYVSEIELIKLDGSIFQMKDTVLLVNIDKQLFDIGKAPVGNYKSLRFKIGLNPLVNNTLPTLNTNFLNAPKMWFNSQATTNEYVFLHCAGKIDTTQSATGLEKDMQPFEFKIGTNAHYATVQMPNKNYSVSLNIKNYIHMYADYSKLYKGVDLSDPNHLSIKSIADNSKNVVTAISNNMSNMFVYE
jgi:hypothetical protein